MGRGLGMGSMVWCVRLSSGCSFLFVVIMCGRLFCVRVSVRLSGRLCATVCVPVFVTVSVCSCLRVDVLDFFDHNEHFVSGLLATMNVGVRVK